MTEKVPQVVVQTPSGDFKTIYGPPIETDTLASDNALTFEEKIKIRRNSISLPAGLDELDLELLDAVHKTQQQQTFNENETSASGTSSYSGDIDDELGSNNYMYKAPNRSVRKKSMAPISMRKKIKENDDFDASDQSYSPANSITSVNSLASLLKEKMLFLQLNSKKRQHSPEFNIRAFVVFLFISIVSIVSLAYILYHQKILHKSYFERIKFNKFERSMKIFNAEGFEIAKGNLAVNISGNVYRCLPEDVHINGSLCLEWMGKARMYLSSIHLNKDVKCFNINWFAIAENIHPTDCYDLKGHWYGGGQTFDMVWPLEKTTSEFEPFITGDIRTHQWGNVLKRYFINSKGVAITIDPKTPLYVSINSKTHQNQICFKAKYDYFAYVNHLNEFPVLNYSICTASNMKLLHYTLSDKTLWDGLKPDDIVTINSLLTEPVWQIAPEMKYELIEESIYNYTENIIALGFLKQGHVLVNEFWQEHVGDFTLDNDRFQTLMSTVEVIHRRGFRIVLSIQPFISTESSNFARCVRNNLLVSERFSDKRIPALTRYKSLASAGVLDFSKNETTPWLRNKLDEIMSKYQIDAFYIDVGTAHDIPHYYQCEKPLANPDEYKTILTNNLQGTVNIIGISSAIQRPRAPIFVSMPPLESSWMSLKKVIPIILTYGIIGYPFVMPGAVGGDYSTIGEYAEFNSTIITPMAKELYIRWLQLNSFLPVIRFNDLPSKYGSDVSDLAKKLTTLRQQLVTPLMKKYAKESLDSGLPIIRPLWMMDPNDQSAHLVIDEFLVGEELIVAPILLPGKRQREVYLPAGVWKDGIDGSLRKGNRWIHNYRVLQDQVAYFQKMPDNTRF